MERVRIPRIVVSLLMAFFIMYFLPWPFHGGRFSVQGGVLGITIGVVLSIYTTRTLNFKTLAPFDPSDKTAIDDLREGWALPLMAFLTTVINAGVTILFGQKGIEIVTEGGAIGVVIFLGYFAVRLILDR